MNRRTFLRGTVLAGAAAVAGCTGDDGTSPESTPNGTLSDGDIVELSGPPCEAVSGTTFRSIEKRDGGLGPEGSETRIHWEVSFASGEYQYSHADVVESGGYSCTVEDGAVTIEGSSSWSDLTYSGTYDPESGVLEWDGVRYRPVETT